MFPNFLIVGAMRSGTTSLYNSLANHPSIYFPHLKEPRFFSSLINDLAKNGPGDKYIKFINSWESYKNLYNNAGGAIATGDASVENLYLHNQVIPKIHQYLGDVKIIIVLRNPYKRAVSAYKYLLMKGRETLTFNDALQEEGNRMKKKWLPIWYYKNNGFYYSQVKSYLNSFSNVKIILFEDLINKPNQTLNEVSHFLLDEHTYNLKDITVSNKSGKDVFYSIYQKNNMLRIIYKTLPRNTRKYFIKYIGQYLSDQYDKSIDLENPLNQCYNEDINKLMGLIERDLRPWLK
ncbi:MAG: sulfotransferase [bacterium]